MLDPEILSLDGRAPRIDVWAQLDQDYAIVVGAGSEIAEDLELQVWVQDESDGDLRSLAADGPDSKFTATVVPLGPSNGIRVTFPANDVAALDPTIRHWVVFASAGQILGIGRFRAGRTGRLGDGTSDVSLTVGGSSMSLQVVTLERSNNDAPGADLPSGTPGQMLRYDEDGELEAVTPNQPGAPLRANSNGHLPDVNLSGEIVRQGEMESAIAAAIADLVGGAPVALDTLNELAAALNDDESFAATITGLLAQMQSDIDGIEGGDGGVQRLGALHLTNLDLESPHPLGAFLPANTRLIQLVGQNDAEENGTYRTPADPATEPLVRDDDQLLALANSGKVVTFPLLIAGGSFTAGTYHFQVLVDLGTPRLALRHGVQWFAQWRTEADPTEPITIAGASFGHQVLVTGQEDDLTVGGLYVYMGAGQTMLRSGVYGPPGSIVYVMTEDTPWTLTPHAGWVPANIGIGAQIDALDDRIDALEADTSAVDLARGTAEAVALLADHSARVEFPGTAATSGGALTTPSLGDVFTDGYEVRIVGRPDFRTSGSLYWEGGGQTNDGTGGLDNHEPAFHRGDPAFPELFDVNALYLFFEAILDGDTEEIVGRLRGKLSTTWGQWCEVMVRADFDTGIVTGWERVTYERNDGSTYVTSAVDGAVFRLVGVADDQTYTSINSSAFDWWIGHDFGGGWRRTVWRNGADGALVDDVRVEDITPGDTTFTSTGGRIWNVGTGVTVVRDAETRLEDLENAPAGDVTGPTSSVDGRAALFDGTTGKLLKQASAAPVLEGDSRLSLVYAKAPAATAAYSNLGTFGTAGSTHGLTAVNRRVWVPIYVLGDTYTRIGVNVTTGAVSTWRLGLHADNGGFPAAAPIADYGTIDMSGASGRRDITISQALASGWYWAQIQVDAFTATPTVTAVVGQSSQPPMPLGFPTDRANAARGRASVRDTGGTGGALGNAPADLSVSGVSLENDAPRVWLWKA